ncbi:MAG: segregation/condensation protein A [Bacilli bacterium]|nr:segregation/condensation protein A [Bacilli bacterium]
MDIKFLINDFEGPLDLLLHLVKESKMDILNINTNEIIEQYLNYIHEMKNLNIDVASEYLVMASELVHLKSKLVLNINDEENNDSEYELNSEEDLKNKLIEYEKYKNMAPQFKDLASKRSEVFTKLPESFSEYQKEAKLSSDITLDDLINAFLNFQKREELNRPLETTITKKELSVEERTKTIRNILKVKKKMNFLDLFDKINKEYVIVTFLSLLEMSKDQEIKITQTDNFSNIFIESMI